MNIRIYLTFILAFIFLSSCKFSAPTFRRLENWNISNVSTTNITLSNNAIFHNPNSFGGINLNKLSLDIFADGRKIGTITNASTKSSIQGNSEFMIPLNLNVNPIDLIGGLGNILDMINGKIVNIRCLGSLNAGYLMINKSVNVDQTIPVNIKNIK